MSTQPIPQAEAAFKSDKVPAVVKELQAMGPKFAAVLPPHVPSERFVRVCLSAINQNPDLLKCEPKSFLQSCLTAAQLGLEPDPNLGQAYFVPFNDTKNRVKKVQLIPGYKGYIALARNSGEISSIGAHEVMEGDLFEYEFGLNEKLRHIPALNDRGAITHFYAIAKFKDGSHHFEVMTWEEVNRIRLKSKMKDSGPWADHFVEMGKKTVIRRLSKYLPLSVQRAAQLENSAMGGRAGVIDEMGGLIIDAEYDETEDPERIEASGTSRLDSLAGSLTQEQPAES